VFKASQAGGPEETENSNINGAELRWHKFEVDCLQERPNKDTYRPCIGEFLFPFLVDSFPAFSLQG